MWQLSTVSLKQVRTPCLPWLCVTVCQVRGLNCKLSCGETWRRLHAGEVSVWMPREDAKTLDDRMISL
jgi:hypothetical protein